MLLIKSCIDALNAVLNPLNAVVVQQFAPDTKEGVRLMEMAEHIGVLAVDSGTIEVPKGMNAATVPATLMLLILVEENGVKHYALDDIIEKKIITPLLSQTHGALTTDDDSDIKYVFVWQTATTDGQTVDINTASGYKRYIGYEIPVTIILTQDLMFGDEVSIEFIDLGYTLGSECLLSWTDTPSQSFEQPVFVNEDIQKSMYVAKAWTFEATFLFIPSNALHTLLENNAKLAPDTLYNVKITKGDKKYRAEVYIGYTDSGQRFKYVISTITLYLHGELKEVT